MSDAMSRVDRPLDEEPAVEDAVVVGNEVRYVPIEPVAAPRSRPALALRRPDPRSWFRGITAIGVKELRGRMRGRRAFVILTVYLLLLAGFAWMLQLILERRAETLGAGMAAYASAEIGRGVFTGLVMLETLLVVALAPAFTAGAISLEREKQTLDLLATTPISSLAIVLGKLISALTYLFILVFASIPLTAIVFVFGGVPPDDVVRAYLVILSAALGLGAIGLFCSALIRRTQAATIATYFTVLGVTAGTFFIFFFWHTMTDGGVQNRDFGPISGRPPEVLNYLNPYFAQADVVCSVHDGFGEWCDRIGFATNRRVFGTSGAVQPAEFGWRPDGVRLVDGGLRRGPLVIVGGDDIPEVAGEDVPGGVEIEPFGVARDGFWPKSAISWLVVSVVLVLGSVQLVTPTRRWKLRRPSIPVPVRRSAP